MKTAPARPRAPASRSRRAPVAAHAHPRRPPAHVRSAEDVERAATLFRALGDVTRLRLACHLGDGEWCVSELAAQQGTKLSTLSQQLRLLHQARIVTRRRDGKHVYYRLADAHVRDLVRAALDHADH